MSGRPALFVLRLWVLGHGDGQSVVGDVRSKVVPWPKMETHMVTSHIETLTVQSG